MAFVMGKDGSVRIGATAMALDSWSLNPSFNTADVTVYGNKTKRNAQTLAEWTGEASGTLDMADAGVVALLDQFKDGTGGAAVDFRCYTAAGNYWSGNGILTGASIGSTVGDKVTVSLSFACAGDLNRT